MGTEVLQLLAVTMGLTGLVVIPFIPVACFLLPKEAWPTRVTAAFAVGTSLQAVLGMLWSHLVGRGPYGELIVLGVLWLTILVWSWRRSRRVAESHPGDSEDSQQWAPLLLILGGAFLVRSIHPLQVAYLGQSDAYTHLHYLRNILDLGRLINPIYPPGYHWILALPALVFKIDPYIVARYAGAFFGTGLVLSLYVLLDRLFSRRAAIFGCFCAACFPLMVLLQKTGVGSFANQVGIMLLPVVMLAYAATILPRRADDPLRVLFPLSMLGLVAAVPMMALHILVILFVERVIALRREGKRWLPTTGRVMLMVIPALVLLVLHVSQAGDRSRDETAKILVGYGKPASTAPAAPGALTASDSAHQDSDDVSVHEHPAFKLVADYVTVKRIKGFGNTHLNALALLLFAIFAGCLIIGTVRADEGLLLLGLWGGITSIQTATGFLQFSAYQREGWSLLVATCGLAGVLTGQIFDRGSRSRLFRGLVILGMGISLTWALWHPPQHPALKSEAEDAFIRTVRFLGQDPETLVNPGREIEGPLGEVARILTPGLPLELVTRRFSAWGQQDEIAPNVLQRGRGLRITTVSAGGGMPRLSKGRQYVILVDKRADASARRSMGAFAMLTPVMVAETLRQQDQLYGVNAKMMEVIEHLPKANWRVRQLDLSPYLSACIVVPARKTEARRED